MLTFDCNARRLRRVPICGRLVPTAVGAGLKPALASPRLGPAIRLWADGRPHTIRRAHAIDTPRLTQVRGRVMSRKKIAAIVTTYFPGSHADLLASRFVKGFPHRFRRGLAVREAPKFRRRRLHVHRPGPPAGHRRRACPRPRHRALPQHPVRPGASAASAGSLAHRAGMGGRRAGRRRRADHRRARRLRPQRARPPDVPAPPLLRAGVRDDRAVRPGRPRLQRQAPGLLVGRRPVDVRPRRRAGIPFMAGSSLPVTGRTPEWSTRPARA